MVALLEKRRFRDFDWLLTLLATGIVLFGTWQIHNAQPTESFWKKQLLGLLISLVALFAVAFTDYRKLVHVAPFFYAFGLVLLVIVLIPGIGMKINGQRCWIRTPGIGQFQPSEFVKIPIVLMLVAYVVGVKTGKIKTYQRQRIEAIIHPETADRRGYAYHTWQSILTVGKGQVTGNGGRTPQYSQSGLKILPSPPNGFI